MLEDSIYKIIKNLLYKQINTFPFNGENIFKKNICQEFFKVYLFTAPSVS